MTSLRNVINRVNAFLGQIMIFKYRIYFFLKDLNKMIWIIKNFVLFAWLIQATAHFFCLWYVKYLKFDTCIRIGFLTKVNLYFYLSLLKIVIFSAMITYFKIDTVRYLWTAFLTFTILYFITFGNCQYVTRIFSNNKCKQIFYLFVNDDKV